MKDNFKTKICNLTYFAQAVPVSLSRNYDFKVCLQRKCHTKATLARFFAKPHTGNLEVKSFYSDPTRPNVEFFLLKLNFRLPNVVRKLRNGLRGLIVVQRGGYSFVFVGKTAFAGLLFCCFSCSVDTSFSLSLIILLAAEQSFELSFTIHVHYFP